MADGIIEKYKDLIKKLNYYSDQYYNHSISVVTDAEYDSLYKELLKIEEENPEIIDKNSPSARVGFKPLSKLKKIIHNVPMLSLENAFSKDDVQKFYDRLSKLLNIEQNKIDIFAEPKIDGVSATIKYSGGHILFAATRGDGIEGEDVTNNIKTINSIPKKIKCKFDMEVRGEIYFTKSSFLELNKLQILNGEEEFSNPRNAASGTIRLLNSDVVANRNLNFFAYQVIGIDSLNTQQEVLSFLESQGFNVNKLSKLCHSISELDNFYNNIMEIRDTLEYCIDGVVYKCNNLEWQKLLGNTSKYPRHSIAHKFPAEQVSTYVEDILLSVGRSGIVTPVAILKPVNIAGVIVSKATLHNKSELERKDIRIGDKVLLERAGDVIPKIVSVFKDNRTPLSKKYIFPDDCPICGNKLYEDGPFIKCKSGNNCSAQFIEKLVHFVSKDAFNIMGLGKNNLIFLIDNGFIKSEIDIFNLEEINKISYKKIQDFDGWGEQSTNKLFAEIKEKSNIYFDKFIYALGIPQVGKNIAKLLAENFTLDKFLNIKNNDVSRLTGILGIGDSIANSIINFLSAHSNFIEEIADKVNIINLKKGNINQSNFFFNKKIVITGTFNGFNRETIKEKLINLGASITESVSSKTDILICGSNPGSKLEKAMNLDVPIMNEDELLNRI